ncbi:hypothetical protein [Nonomuraea sp. NPDC005650]|uniref:hypothetical protein n=1 Tax=Nonomuraea sp. NPDC005650 TaxID=3157045 RepID=UPI0033A3ADDC
MNFSRKRIVPIAVWRKLMTHLSPTAIAAGERRRLELDGYRRDRNSIHSDALDQALVEQAGELADALTARDDRDSLANMVTRLWRRLRPEDRPWTSMAGGNGDVAGFLRANAVHARAVADRLRELAEVADTIALGQEIRAEDYAYHQHVVDFLAAVRGENQSPLTEGPALTTQDTTQDTIQSLAALLMERAGLADSAELIPQLKAAGVTWHATKPLENAEIKTFGALKNLSEVELEQVPGFGERRRDMVKGALRRLAGEAE